MADLTNVEIINTWFQEVWNEGRVDTIDRLLDDNCVVTGLVPGEINSCQHFKQFQKQIFESYSNFRIEVLNTISSGSDVASLVKCRGIHNNTGKEVDFNACFIGKITNGKISEAYNVVDFLSPLLQTGIIEEVQLEQF